MPASDASEPLLSRMLFRVLRAMGCGAVLLNAGKQVVHLNARARACLGDGLALRGGELAATDRGCDVILQATLYRHLAAAAEPRAPMGLGGDALGLKRLERRPLIVRVVPVAPEMRAALLVIVVDPEDCPEPSDGMLQQVFGLTKGEARVANRLMCGRSLAEIAADHGVEIGTVRSQVKSIFAKTQTSRQAELVALMTRLAAICED